MKKILYSTLLLVYATALVAEQPCSRAARLSVQKTNDEKKEIIPVVERKDEPAYMEDDVESFINDTTQETPIPEIRPVSWLEAKAKQIALAVILPLYAAKQWCSGKLVAFWLYLQSLKGN